LLFGLRLDTWNQEKHHYLHERQSRHEPPKESHEVHLESLFSETASLTQAWFFRACRSTTMTNPHDLSKHPASRIPCWLLAIVLVARLGAGTAQAQYDHSPLLDGSGSLQLPGGWQVLESNQGAVVAGNGESFVELGIAAQMSVPAPNMFGWVVPTACPYGPVEQVFPLAQQTLWNLTQQVSGAVRHFERVVERQSAGGNSGFFVYDWTLNGRPMRSLSLVIATTAGWDSWLFYQSTVSAPRERFAQQVPQLLSIWTSYRVDPRVGASRLKKAAASMASCHQMIDGVHQRRQAAYDQANEAFTDYLRDQTYVRDQQTGELYETSDDYDVNPLLDAMNRREGGQRYIHDPRPR
jgi:hypothetical protein